MVLQIVKNKINKANNLVNGRVSEKAGAGIILFNDKYHHSKVKYYHHL
jgi:hypothetical protein